MQRFSGFRAGGARRRAGAAVWRVCHNRAGAGPQRPHGRGRYFYGRVTVWIVMALTLEKRTVPPTLMVTLLGTNDSPPPPPTCT